MNTATISVAFGGCNFPPAAVEPDLPVASARVPNSVASWRKAILLNRSALLSAWPRHFPHHNFSDLRLISPNPADSYWDGESWRRAARSYHVDRKRGFR
jgi:hypothetical protein